MKIAGSRALITGAGSGIGRATALRLARAGAAVVAVDIDAESAEATADDCAAAAGCRAPAGGRAAPGGAAACYACDVADGEAVLELAERVEEEVGPVDVLVNNAGVGVAGAFLRSSLEDWEWLRGVNLDGVVHGCHAFGARMVRRGRGHVVNIASGAGYTPNRNMAAYCASKAAVIMLSQCLRADWASSGVGVSVICPGLIKTPIASKARMVGSMEGKREAALRLFRFGHSPDVVAKAIASAVERNREIVPVGIESALALNMSRFAPGPIRGLLARAEVL